MSLETNIAASKAKTADLLFEPIRLGRMTLPHRIAMAPLTRSRARQPGNIPTPLNASYYVQRSSAALIISEATQVSLQGQGYAWTPGIHSRAQIEGWRLVTDAVRAASGRIFLQLWHVGRISHPALQPDRMLPVAPSAIRPAGQAFIENDRGEGELVPFVTPRALDIVEMPYIVQQYERGARNALAAGFDGVEIHSANGYLLDQFINSLTNTRTDAYGGSIAGRSRLLFEVVEAVKGVWGGDRVGVRLSPLGTFNDIGDSDPEATFGAIAEQLSAQDLAYLHLVNPATADLDEGREPNSRALAILDLMRAKYRGTLMLAGGFDRDRAEAWLQKGAQTSSRSGESFWQTPTSPGASASARRSMPMTRPLITEAAQRATRTTRRLNRSGAKHPSPA